jgi:hypothetical protein
MPVRLYPLLNKMVFKFHAHYSELGRKSEGLGVPRTIKRANFFRFIVGFHYRENFCQNKYINKYSQINSKYEKSIFFLKINYDFSLEGGNFELIPTFFQTFWLQYIQQNLLM